MILTLIDHYGKTSTAYVNPDKIKSIRKFTDYKSYTCQNPKNIITLRDGTELRVLESQSEIADEMIK